MKPKTLDLKLRVTYKDSLNTEIVENKVVRMPLYDKGEAIKLGLITNPRNLASMFITFGIQIIVLVFAVFMLVDCWKNGLPKYKKVLWTILIITGALSF